MFKRRKLKKYFLQHPEKLESLREEVQQFSNHMDRIIKDEDIPSFDDFLDRHKNIAPYFDKSQQKHQLKSGSKYKPLYKRFGIVIPTTIALILCVFMVFTPVGKALADSIYKTIVHWFDDSVNIHHGLNDASEENQNSVAEYYSTIEDIQSKLNTSITYNNQAELYEEIEVAKDDFSTKIKSTYLFNSQQIIVTQAIFEIETEWDSNIQFNDGKPIDEALDDNTRFIGYVQDGFGYVIAYINNMKIEIYAENIEYDHFISFIRGMVID